MMQKVDKVPLAKAKEYRGMWVALNKSNEVVAAAGKLEEISDLVVGTKKYPAKFTSYFIPQKGYLKPFPLPED